MFGAICLAPTVSAWSLGLGAGELGVSFYEPLLQRGRFSGFLGPT